MSTSTATPVPGAPTAPGALGVRSTDSRSQAAARRHSDFAPDPRAALLRPTVTLLPAAATSLFTLLSVGPEARAPMFAHVAQDSARLDAARDRVMAQLTSLHERDRAPAIRLAQSAALLGRLVLAVARVAAHGDVGRLPPQCPELAREVVGITEQIAGVELGDIPPSRRSGRLALRDTPRRMSEAAELLDQLMWRLTGHASGSGADTAWA